MTKTCLFIRSCLFSLCFLIWLIGLGIISLPALLLPQPIAVLISRLWVKGVLSMLQIICGISYQVEGLEHLPATPCLIASKHQSTWETIAFCNVLQNPCFILKQELFMLPFFGWFLKKLKMIGIDRSQGKASLRKMLKESTHTFQQNRHIIIFPEGTRTAPGQTKPYNSGIAALYSQLNVPIIPTALNSGVFWGRKRFIKSPGCITLQFLPAIMPGKDKNNLMQQLQETIETASKALL